MASNVEQIKARLSTVDVVSSYLKLLRAGANFKAVCPFHKEKSPSFFVSPARDSWHCFGCGKGGDQIKFVMEMEGIDFREALGILARRAGVELTHERAEVRDERSRLFAILEEAARWYESNFARTPEVRSYMKNRGVSAGSLKTFRLGYALSEQHGWRTLLEHLRAKGYKEAEMEKVGLILRKESTKSQLPINNYQVSPTSYYDRFRNRIMFPITDANGRVIGFGGRVFGEATETVAKYINTPQTILYDKSRVLYGFDKAKLELRRTNTVVLVEGYMDALMAHQAGTANTVAVSGTALTPPQLQMLRRLCDKLLMSFDSDEAGESATRRSIDLALEAGFEVQIIGLKAKDPADVVQDNPAVWKRAVEEAQEAIAFFLARALERFDARSVEGKRAISKAILPLVAKVSHEIEKSHWVSRVAGALGVKEEAVWEDLKKIRVLPIPNTQTGAARGDVSAPEPAAAKTRLEMLEGRLLGLHLLGPLPALASINEDVFSLPLHRSIFTSITGVMGGSKAMLAVLPEEAQTLANRLLFEAELTGMENYDAEAALCIAEIARERTKARLETLALEIRRTETAGDARATSALVSEFSELSRRLT